MEDAKNFISILLLEQNLLLLDAHWLMLFISRSILRVKLPRIAWNGEKCLLEGGAINFNKKKSTDSAAFTFNANLSFLLKSR